MFCSVGARDEIDLFPLLAGLGGGLLGGALLANAFEDHEQDAYNEGRPNLLLSHSLT